jgi:alcohol dehydrogenase
MSPGAQKLQSRYHHGSFAKGTLIPLESVYKIPRSLVDKWGVQKLNWIQMLLVSYGQLKSANFQPGATVLLTPATGFFSSLGIPAALALGAGKVIAAGRTQSKLDRITSKYPSRVSTFKYTGNVEADTGALVSQFPELSVVVDLLPSGTTDTSSTLSALLALRTGGTIVLGGGADSINLPYSALVYKNLTVKGQMMYEKKWIPELISLVDAGLIDLGLFEEQSFTLDKINEGIKGAQTFAGMFQLTTLDLKD